MLKAAPVELKTIRDVLRFAVSRFNEARLFFGHGSHDAYDEAAYLILHTLHLPLDRLEPFLDAALPAEEMASLLRIIERRVKERIPAAYLTNEAWLAEHRFYVDQRVIVPRSFIAELLADQLSPWIADPDRVRRILDLCTGSACLAILAAEAFPDAAIDASDVCREALEVASRNLSDYGLTERIELIESDLFDSLAGRSYDFIIANPPYVNAESMATLPTEYRHEPAQALAGGLDGLALVRRILNAASRHLTENGILIVEIGHNRAALEAAYPRLELSWLATSGGDDRVFLVSREALDR
jgi:ribosomal protein L3 glutamine methyltransferase